MKLNPNVSEIIKIHDDLYMVFEKISNISSCRECDLACSIRKCAQVHCSSRFSGKKNIIYRLIDTIIC